MPLVNGHHIPAHLSEVQPEEFLGQGIVVGPVFGLNGRGDVDYCHVWDWTDLSNSIWEDDDGRYAIVALEDFEPYCLVLKFRSEAVGFYLDGQAWVDPEHRGKGLGAAMIVAAVAYLGALPEIKDIGFSESGYAAHLSALRTIRDAAANPCVVSP